MTNLEKAKRNYPKGTVFKSSFSNEETISTGDMVAHHNYIQCNGYNVYTGVIGKWAEIITRPEISVKDVVKWEVYRIEAYGSQQYDIKAKLYIQSGKKNNDGLFIRNSIKSIHLANTEEYELLMGGEKEVEPIEEKTPNRITAEAIVHLKSLGYKILKPTFEEI
jgi:hypothetical protein